MPAGETIRLNFMVVVKILIKTWSWFCTVFLSPWRLRCVFCGFERQKNHLQRSVPGLLKFQSFGRVELII